MASNNALFFKMQTISLFEVGMDSFSRDMTCRRGTVPCMLLVSQCCAKWILESFLYVVSPTYSPFPVGVMDKAKEPVLLDEVKCLMERNWTTIGHVQRMEDLYIFQTIPKAWKSSDQAAMYIHVFITQTICPSTCRGHAIYHLEEICRQPRDRCLLAY